MKEVLPAIQRVANEVNNEDNTVLVLKKLTSRYNEIGEAKRTMELNSKSEEWER